LLRDPPPQGGAPLGRRVRDEVRERRAGRARHGRRARRARHGLLRECDRGLSEGARRRAESSHTPPAESSHTPPVESSHTPPAESSPPPPAAPPPPAPPQRRPRRATSSTARHKWRRSTSGHGSGRKTISA